MNQLIKNNFKIKENELSSEEIKSTNINLEKDIIELEQEINDTVLEMAKDAKKNKLNNIRHNNHMIKLKFERLDSLKLYLEQGKKRLVRALRIEGGFQEIVYFLEMLFENDIEWYKQLIEKYNTEIKPIQNYKERIKVEKDWNKSDLVIAKMNEDEAKLLFEKDLNVRFEKLINQLQDRVGKVKGVNIQRNANGKFDGVVIGENGVAHFETIIAGGHSVQRLHYRTLMK